MSTGIILLDSGVSQERNIGDQAILDKTLLQYPNATVLNADFPIHKKYRRNPKCWLDYFEKIVRSSHIHIVSGGLFKSTGEMYVFRKYLTVLLAKILRKKLSVGTQTFYLKGFSRIFFKMLFKGLIVPARDNDSLSDLVYLGIDSFQKNDLVIEKKPKGKHKPIILIDSRLLENFEIKIVPTIHTDKNWRKIEMAVGEARLVLASSFHLAVFASNNNVPCVAICNSEYYRRKFMGLTE